MYRSTWAAMAVLLLTSTAVLSQGTASDPAAERQAFIDKMRALNWVKGPTTVSVEGSSKLVIPDQYVFLDARNTTRFLELQHNLGDGREVMVAPSNMEWMAYLEFSAEGYVKDNEKIDAVALLKTLQENTASGNEQRRSRGWSELRLVDWATPPVYNTATKRLEWATILDSREGRAVNFSTKILGRRGYTSVIMVTDPVNLDAAESSLDHVLGGYSFNSGETYGDWRSGDKVAKYGLAALIVGGVAAVAAKKGLFSVLAGFLAVAWKFIMVGVVAAMAWVRKLFAKKAGLMSGFEVGLPVGALALYLFDSSLLLYANEFIYRRRIRGVELCAEPALLLAGRRVYFPNPLTPGTPSFRVRWSESDPREEQEDRTGLDRFLGALRPVQYLVNTLLVILFALPVELILFGTGVELLAVMAVFYLVILVTLGYIYVRRHELYLSGRSFLALCFDSLACAPFAINLARKLALRRGLAGNPIAFAARAFEPAEFSSLLRAVGARVSEEQQREYGQTARWVELEAYRQRLAAMAPDQPPPDGSR